LLQFSFYRYKIYFVDSGPPDEWIRGNASNIPFWPGGLDWNPEVVSTLHKMDDLLDELSFKKGDLET